MSPDNTGKKRQEGRRTLPKGHLGLTLLHSLMASIGYSRPFFFSHPFSRAKRNPSCQSLILKFSAITQRLENPCSSGSTRRISSIDPLVIGNGNAAKNYAPPAAVNSRPSRRLKTACDTQLPSLASSSCAGRRPCGVSLSTKPGRTCDSCAVTSCSDIPVFSAKVLTIDGPSAEPIEPGEIG